MQPAVNLCDESRWQVEDTLSENGGPFFLGERFSLVDIMCPFGPRGLFMSDPRDPKKALYGRFPLIHVHMYIYIFTIDYVPIVDSYI